MRIVIWKKSNEAEVLRAAAQALRRGFLVAYPTETSYGLGADATQNTAVRKLFAVKGRSFQKPVHVVVSGEPMASSISHWNHSARALAETFWPGPLTLVLRARLWGEIALPGAALELLTAGTNQIGLRMPAHVVPLALVHLLGRPITATSVNVSNQGDCYSEREVVAQFRGRKLKPDILISAGTLPKQKPSTVVRLTQREHVEILREGPVGEKDIARVLRKSDTA